MSQHSHEKMLGGRLNQKYSIRFNIFFFSDEIYCGYPFGSSSRKIAFTCSLKLASMCELTLTSISPRFQSLRRHKKQYFCLCLRFSWVVAPFIVDDRLLFSLQLLFSFFFQSHRSKFSFRTQHQSAAVLLSNRGARTDIETTNKKKTKSNRTNENQKKRCLSNY